MLTSSLWIALLDMQQKTTPKTFSEALFALWGPKRPTIVNSKGAAGYTLFLLVNHPQLADTFFCFVLPTFGAVVNNFWAILLPLMAQAFFHILSGVTAKPPWLSL